MMKKIINLFFVFCLLFMGTNFVNAQNTPQNNFIELTV